MICKWIIKKKKKMISTKSLKHPTPTLTRSHCIGVTSVACVWTCVDDVTTIEVTRQCYYRFLLLLLCFIIIIHLFFFVRGQFERHYVLGCRRFRSGGHPITMRIKLKITTYIIFFLVSSTHEECISSLA